MNITATIAWSLIWSVYPDWPYYGNGLSVYCVCDYSFYFSTFGICFSLCLFSLSVYAYTPWANFYTVNDPIWTSAHTTQFTQVCVFDFHSLFLTCRSLLLLNYSQDGSICLLVWVAGIL